MEFANINALSETGLGARDETIQKNSKQILAIIRAVFRAMAFANAHPEETMRMLVSWVKVDEEVAAKSYDLGKRSWSERESFPTERSKSWSISRYSNSRPKTPFRWTGCATGVLPNKHGASWETLEWRGRFAPW